MKIVLPAETFSNSAKFLRLAGVGDFGCFPDLEGLRKKLLEDLDAEVATIKELMTLKKGGLPEDLWVKMGPGSRKAKRKTVDKMSKL